MFTLQSSFEHSSLQTIGDYFSLLMSSKDIGLCHIRVEWIVTVIAQNIFQ